MLALFAAVVAAAVTTPKYDRGLHMDGALLPRLCSGYGTSEQCESYVVGVMDGMLSADDLLASRGRDPLFLCPAHRIAVPEAVRTVKAYIEAIQNTEQLGQTAAPTIIARALASSYPCRSPRRPK